MDANKNKQENITRRVFDFLFLITSSRNISGRPTTKSLIIRPPKTVRFPINNSYLNIISKNSVIACQEPLSAASL